MLLLALLAVGPSRPPSDSVDVAIFTPAPILVRLHLRLGGAALQSRFDALMDDVFRDLDKNRDGILDKKELARLPDLGGNGLINVGGNFAFGGMPKADIPDKLTRAGLAAHYARQGIVPFRVVAAGDPSGRGRTPAAITNRLFKLLDKNGDGVLDAKELVGAEKELLRHDADEDELISVAEVLDERAQPDTILLGGPAGADARDWLPLRSAADLWEAKRRFKEAGRTLDVSRPDAVAKLDLGGRGATVELAAKSKGVAVRGEVLEIGNVSIRFGGLTTGPGFALARLAPEEQAKQLLQQADADKNGYVDREEAKRNPFFMGKFDAIDADGDGMIVEKEIKAYLVRTEELTAKVKAATAQVSVSEAGNGLFDLLDLDGDGTLTLREMRRAPEVLKRLKKEKLSPKDMPRQFRASMGPGQFGGGGFLAFVVGVGFGDTALPRKKAKGPEWFRRMDRNGDGDLSPSEWLGTKEEFDAMDADKDGLVSLAEAEAWLKRKKR